MHGLQARCAGVHALGGPFSSILEVRDEMADLLVELANRSSPSLRPMSSSSLARRWPA